MEITHAFARIDLLHGKPADYRATLADIVYRGIVDVLKAPDGDRFVVVSQHSSENLIYDAKFLGLERSPDFTSLPSSSANRPRSATPTAQRGKASRQTRPAFIVMPGPTSAGLFALDFFYRGIVL